MTTYSTPGVLEETLRTAPVIPVVTIRRVEDAVPLAQALVRGGLPVIEVTLRSDSATAAIRQIRDRVPEAIPGAGTILREADLQRVRDAGAVFGVSPGLTPDLAAAIIADGMPFLPGVATASEIMRAREYGFRFLKFFPAAASGGLDALSGFAGPFPEVSFCPTGGIREQTLHDYLSLRNVVCAGGSWLVTENDLQSGNWDAVTERAARITRRP